MSRNILQVFMMALLASTVSGCAALVVGGAAAGGYYVGKDDRTLSQISEDAAITSRINALYVKDDLVSAMDVNVDTRNGVVTLYGPVPSAAAAARAVSLARGTKGVKQVISRLSIGQ